MSLLVDDLLLLARLDEGRPLEREPVELDEVVTEAVETARTVEPGAAARARRRAGVVARRPRPAAPGRRQPARNVRAHTPPGRPCDVGVGSTTGRVVEVADDGPGFEREAARVFERFYRADESRSRASGGVGLGLSIVAAVAEAHGGEASAHSRRARARPSASPFPPKTEARPPMTEHELTRAERTRSPAPGLGLTLRRSRRSRRHRRCSPATLARGDARRSRDDDDPTPEQTEGPYWTPRSPLRRSIVPAGATRDAPDDHRPRAHDRPDSRVPRAPCSTFWQCDAGGVYDNERLPLPRPPARRRTRAVRAADGRARASNTGRTRHIHVKVQSAGRRRCSRRSSTSRAWPATGADGIFDPVPLLLQAGVARGRGAASRASSSCSGREMAIVRRCGCASPCSRSPPSRSVGTRRPLGPPPLRVLFVGQQPDRDERPAGPGRRAREGVAATGRRGAERSPPAAGRSRITRRLGEAPRVLASQHWDAIVLQQGPSALPESQVNLRTWATRIAADARERGTRPRRLLHGLARELPLRGVPRRARVVSQRSPRGPRRALPGRRRVARSLAAPTRSFRSTARTASTRAGSGAISRRS